MQRNKPIKILLIVGIITLGLTIVAATNGSYSSRLFKPQIIKQKHMDNDNLYEVLTSYEIWEGTGTGEVTTPDGNIIHPWASWVGTVRTAGGNKVITGTWIDDDTSLSSPAYGGFTGNINANDSVTNGIWWSDNPQLPNSGTWQAHFYMPPNSSRMQGTWQYSDQNASGNGTMDGYRTQ